MVFYACGHGLYASGQGFRLLRLSLPTLTKKIENHMEQSEKTVYEAPEIQIFEVKAEGVICASGEHPDYNPIAW